MRPFSKSLFLIIIILFLIVFNDRGVPAVKFLEGQKKIAKKGSIFFITLLITLLIFITLLMNVYAKNII